jgi:hypothetical protein
MSLCTKKGLLGQKMIFYDFKDYFSVHDEIVWLYNSGIIWINSVRKKVLEEHSLFLIVT